MTPTQHVSSQKQDKTTEFIKKAIKKVLLLSKQDFHFGIE